MSHHYGHAQEAHESDAHYAARTLLTRATHAHHERFGQTRASGTVIIRWYQRRQGRNTVQRIMRRAHKTVHLEYIIRECARLGLGIEISVAW